MKFCFPLDEDFEIKVGAHTWKIVFAEATGLTDGHSHAWGTCDVEKQTIYIDRNAPYSMRLSTFFHELIHVFESVYDVEMQHRDVNLVGDALAQVLVDSFQVKKSSSPKTAKKKPRKKR